MIKPDSLDKSEAARYMGVKGTPDNAVSELLDTAEKLVLERIAPKYVYRETSVTFCDDGVRLECMDALLTGNAIKKHLAGCERAVILAATLSAEADKLIRQTSYENMALSLAVDCLCSSAIEQVCNLAEEEIFADRKDVYRTWRFSAGYGDLPLELQSEFLKSLNAQRRIGLTVTSESLLIPSKSVTAIIGISETPVERGKRGCDICSRRESCQYGKSGKQKCGM